MVELQQATADRNINKNARVVSGWSATQQAGVNIDTRVLRKFLSRGKVADLGQRQHGEIDVGVHTGQREQTRMRVDVGTCGTLARVLVPRSSEAVSDLVAKLRMATRFRAEFPSSVPSPVPSLHTGPASETI